MKWLSMDEEQVL